MKLKVLYCRSCGWVAQENMQDLVMPNVCPQCSLRGLSFVVSEDWSTVRRRLEEVGVQVPRWLRDVAYKNRGENAEGL